MFVFRYDQTSAQVKALEDQAQRLSSEARDEATEATTMLRDISKLEQELPSALKVRAQVHAGPQNVSCPHRCCPCPGRRGRHGLCAEGPVSSSHQERPDL